MSEERSWQRVDHDDITPQTQNQQNDFNYDFLSEAIHNSLGNNVDLETATTGGDWPSHQPEPMDSGTAHFDIRACTNVSANISNQSRNDGIGANSTARNCHRKDTSSSSSNGIISSTSSPSKEHSVNDANGGPSIKYPVLRPLLPYLVPVCSTKTACDLLDGYFATASENIFLPSSPYIIAHVVRKKSLLHSDHPRRCSPALLASMLWLSAQTTEYHFFGNSPTLRSQLTQKLFDLTISLLDKQENARQNPNTCPVSKTAKRDARSRASVDGIEPHPCAQSGVRHVVPTLDDVITFMHLGIVISARESKPAGFRWWHTAFQLAKELKLNKEISDVPGLDQERNRQPVDAYESPSNDGHHRDTCSPGCFWSSAAVDGEDSRELDVTEEQREERRRTWWTLYILDRHLALCYNSSLALKDSECQGLLPPMDEITWQVTFDNLDAAQGQQNFRSTSGGPPTKSSSLGMFELFLPVASVLGQIIDFHHAKSHPRLGQMFSSGSVLSAFIGEITTQILDFEQSLFKLETIYATDSALSSIITSLEALASNTNSPGSEAQLTKLIHQSCKNQARLFLFYGRFWSNTLNILLYSTWDISDMLSSTSSHWISTPSSATAIRRAVCAAKSLDKILKIDYDLTFSPYFLGIYLIQGAFVVLVAAIEGGEYRTAEVLDACETFVRAHEVCVVTLHAEYLVRLFSCLHSSPFYS